MYKRSISVIVCLTILLTAPACHLLQPQADLPEDICRAIETQHRALSIIADDYTAIIFMIMKGVERDKRLVLLYHLLRVSAELYAYAKAHGLLPKDEAPKDEKIKKKTD